jgi:hypothetical protein
MRIDIMDLFEFPEAAKGQFGGYEFEISFPNLSNGTLDVCIKNGNQVIEYSESYYHSSLKSTLKAVGDLLPSTENYDSYFGCLRNRTRFVHSLEKCQYVYDLKTFMKRNDTRMWIQILIMEDRVDYDGIWFSEDDFEDFCYTVGGLNALKENKIFSVELPFRFFLKMFYNSCRDFILRKTFKKYLDEIKEGFPLKELTRMKPYLNGL